MRVLVLGANGGLGEAVIRTALQRGAHVMVAGRRRAGAQSMPPDLRHLDYHILDIDQPASVRQLATQLEQANTFPHVIINTIGRDFRGPLHTMSDADVDTLIAVNIQGAISVTRAFSPRLLKVAHARIVHVIGFGDGRLAFPFFAVDVATRAAVVSFSEAMNRELSESQLRIHTFSPAPADTAAERPFHRVWQTMGFAIEPPDKVAAALIRAIERDQDRAIMGYASRLFSALNAISPGLANCLAMSRYQKILADHFEDVPQG